MFCLDKSKAAVSHRKIRDYLLNDIHPVGKHKSRYFKAIGYSIREWHRLERDLLRQLNYHATCVKVLPYGKLYRVTGDLNAPTGVTVTITTIWFVSADDGSIRLVTAYPEN